MPSRHDDVTSLDESQMRHVRLVAVEIKNIIDPRAGRVDDSLELASLRTIRVFENSFPMIGVTRERCAPGPRQDFSAARLCINGVQDNKARILNPAIRILERQLELVLQSLQFRRRFAAKRGRCGQDLSTAQMIVDEQAQSDQPSWAQLLVVRQDEPHRPDDVRCGSEQDLSLY